MFHHLQISSPIYGHSFEQVLCLIRSVRYLRRRLWLEATHANLHSTLQIAATPVDLLHLVALLVLFLVLIRWDHACKDYIANGSCGSYEERVVNDTNCRSNVECPPVGQLLSTVKVST